MKQKDAEKETWLDLSDAANYLGVHFTTLRRWADAGNISCIRTPGGRRRFSIKELNTFIQQMYRPSCTSLALPQPFETRAIDHARQNAQSLAASGGEWMGRLSEDQRSRLKGTGHRLMALLLQYNSRSEGDEAFLEEGRRIAREYSQICSKVGLTVTETVRVFLFFRRSILDAIYETGSLGGITDPEGQRLYHRTTNFMDELLLSLIDSHPGNSLTWVDPQA